MMRIFTTVLAVCLMLGSAGPAFSRGRSHSASGGHRGGHHGGHVYGFATSRCKSASCFRKHPDGRYVHPLTTRKRPASR